MFGVKPVRGIRNPLMMEAVVVDLFLFPPLPLPPPVLPRGVSVRDALLL